MEIMLLWLDDLDDLIFAVVPFWRSICRIGLAVGLLAALLVSPALGSQLHISWVAGLSAVAAGSVLAWLSAAAPLIRRSPLSA